jgi:hypothetical protein
MAETGTAGIVPNKGFDPKSKGLSGMSKGLPEVSKGFVEESHTGDVRSWEA